MVDVDSIKWTEMARTARAPLGWIYQREARCLEQFEIEAIQQCAPFFERKPGRGLAIPPQDVEDVVRASAVPRHFSIVAPRATDRDFLRRHEL
jgi:hypothetical protein